MLMLMVSHQFDLDNFLHVFVCGRGGGWCVCVYVHACVHACVNVCMCVYISHYSTRELTNYSPSHQGGRVTSGTGCL